MKLNDYDILDKSYKEEASHTYSYHTDRYIFASQYCKGKKVLDLGCGSGFGSSLMLNAGAKQVHGADFKESISSARKNYKGDNKRFFLHEISGLNYDFPDNYFDIVCAFEVIEHVENRISFLNEIKRITKKGGLVILSTPNKRIISPFRIKYPDPKKIPPHKIGYPHLIEYSFMKYKWLIEKSFSETKFYGQMKLNNFQIFIYQMYFTFVPEILRKNIPLGFIDKLRSFIDGGKRKIKENKKEVRFETRKIKDCLHFISVSKK